MKRERLETADHAGPTAWGKINDRCGWDHRDGRLMHALLYVQPREWFMCVTAAARSAHLIDWTTQRLTVPTPAGVIHIEPDPALDWNEIDIVLRGGLTYEDCIREGERWMQLAVDAKTPASPHD